MARARLKPGRTKRQEGPSAASLREIPELDLTTAISFGRGPDGLRNALKFMAATRGRPRKGDQPAGSSTRSLRLTDAAWAELERRADDLDMPLHKLLRWIVAGWLYGGERAKSKGVVKRRRRAA